MDTTAATDALTTAALLRGDDNDPRCEIEVVCAECSAEARDTSEPVTHACGSRARWIATIRCPDCHKLEPLMACDDHYDFIREAIAEDPAETAILGITAATEWRPL